MSTLTDMSLEPIYLHEEFEVEEQEPDEDDSSNASSSGFAPFDFLRLSADPQLQRFFDSIATHGPIHAAKEADGADASRDVPGGVSTSDASSSSSSPSSMRELLLLSTPATIRDVDEEMRTQSRRPVIQADHAQVAAQRKQRQREREAMRIVEQYQASQAAAQANLISGNRSHSDMGSVAAASPSPPSSAPPSTSSSSANLSVRSRTTTKPSLWARIKQEAAANRSGRSNGSSSVRSSTGTSGSRALSPAGGLSSWLKRQLRSADDGKDGRQRHSSPHILRHASSPAHDPLSILAHESFPLDGCTSPPPSVLSPTYAVAVSPTGPTNQGQSEQSVRQESDGQVVPARLPSRTHSRSPSISTSPSVSAAAFTSSSLPPAPSPVPPVDPDGDPCTLVLTNLALYIFPPAIPIEIDVDVEEDEEEEAAVDAADAATDQPDAAEEQSKQQSTGQRRIVHRKETRYFLVYNTFRRISLQDVLLLSLPYRTGLSKAGNDFALRITDFALHLRSGLSVWLKTPRNKRSLIVEMISDAYQNLLGLPLELMQPDYAELIADMLSGKIWTTIRELQRTWWATREVILQGYLWHRSAHVYPMSDNADASPLSPHSPSSPSSPSSTPSHRRHQHRSIRMQSSPPSSWRLKWFVLTRDNYLLHFDSAEEMEAFKFVATAPQDNGCAGKFPASFDCNQIDLSKSLYLRSKNSSSSDGTGIGTFEIIVYPRSTCMPSSTTFLSPLNQHHGTEHDDGGDGEDDADDAESRSESTMAFGYTRHLFHIPEPEQPNPHSPSSNTRRVKQSLSQTLKMGVMTAVRKSSSHSPTAAATSPRLGSAPLGLHVSTHHPASSSPPLPFIPSPAVIDYMEEQTDKWLNALRQAMKGSGPWLSQTQSVPVASDEELP